MKLFNLVQIVERVAMSQPAVRTIVRDDIFKINSRPDVKYGVFAWQQGSHEIGEEGDGIRWQFTFFYADRLTANGDNYLEVESVGVEVLANIVKQLRDTYGFGIDSVVATPFRQRFADECAGVYASVRIETPADDLCADDYGDFNDDYNFDFSLIIK